jgi:acetylornithine deacetylase/succinyl-diaminopimelate desuccinylase-like protein
MIRTLLLCSALMACPAAAAPVLTAKGDAADAKALLMAGVGFDTVKGRGRTPAYAAFLKDYLVKGGFAPADISITEMAGTAALHLHWPGKANAKAKSKQAPIAITAHMDVVEANPKDWVRDPFTAVEDGGFIFGRGIEDNKFDLTMVVATLVRLKAAGFTPGRDIHLFLSGDEETDGFTAAEQAKQAKALGIEYMLNTDAGGGMLTPDGQAAGYWLQAAEKSYADYRITLTDPGGHSSTPGASNAIARMGSIAVRIGAYRFPAEINEITRGALTDAASKRSDAIGKAMAAFVANPADEAAIATLRADPGSIGQIATTCVPTLIEGGHAPNALPQRVVMTVNCRIFPGTSVAAVRDELARIAADPDAKVTSELEWLSTPASPLRPDVMGAVGAAVAARHPGMKPVPSMSAGATDSVYYRAAGIPSYGVGSLFMKVADSFPHGLNERVPASAIAPGLAHWEVLIRQLAR